LAAHPLPRRTRPRRPPDACGYETDHPAPRPAPPQDGCTARLFDNKVAGNAAGSVRVDVGSVAVDVSEVNGKNALDTPAAAIRL
jgi:hypothetical protein